VALGLGRQRVEQRAADALAARLLPDVDAVLADAVVHAAIGVRADAREAEHATVLVVGDEERQAGLEPRADVRRLARARLERGLAFGDAGVVERRDRVGVARLGGADGDQGLRALMIADPACWWTRGR
jgi:hypothetical protein